ncbi:MAG: N-acetylmuramoyl-L-alanine amidase [Pseudomonadota bacterium]|nr:N-acetylmuramoyl-L-alanine amidase [Pseudomonadota bacterium]
MKHHCIFLSAGHSNTDPGAVANGLKEADVAVEFRNMVAHYLRDMGIPHAADGGGKTNLPLGRAAKLAAAYAIAVEFHCNAAANPAATGAEVLSGTTAFTLADKLSTAIASALGIRNRGAKPENAGQHSRLAFVRAGGLIVELFFLTNPEDVATYAQRKWLAAKAVAKVLAEELQRLP